MAGISGHVRAVLLDAMRSSINIPFSQNEMDEAMGAAHARPFGRKMTNEEKREGRRKSFAMMEDVIFGARASEWKSDAVFCTTLRWSHLYECHGSGNKIVSNPDIISSAALEDMWNKIAEKFSDAELPERAMYLVADLTKAGRTWSPGAHHIVFAAFCDLLYTIADDCDNAEELKRKIAFFEDAKSLSPENIPSVDDMCSAVQDNIIDWDVPGFIGIPLLNGYDRAREDGLVSA